MIYRRTFLRGFGRSSGRVWLPDRTAEVPAVANKCLIYGRTSPTSSSASKTTPSCCAIISRTAFRAARDVFMLPRSTISVSRNVRMQRRMLRQNITRPKNTSTRHIFLFFVSSSPAGPGRCCVLWFTLSILQNPPTSNTANRKMSFQMNLLALFEWEIMVLIETVGLLTVAPFYLRSLRDDGTGRRLKEWFPWSTDLAGVLVVLFFSTSTRSANVLELVGVGPDAGPSCNVYISSALWWYFHYR